MLIFDENNKAILLDSIYTPTFTDHFWILDLDIYDFTIVPLVAFEEITCPSLELQIDEHKIILPSMWNILIIDKETSQLDTIEISKSLGKNLFSLVCGHNSNNYELLNIRCTNYLLTHINIAPLLNKNQLLCHPIAPNKFICITPYDVYSKYLKNIVIGDII